MRPGRAVVGLILVIGLCFVASGLPAVARLGGHAAVDPRVLADTADGGRTSVVVFMADQADVRAARSIKSHQVRGRSVVDTLTRHAANSQAPLASWLRARGVEYQSFWVANMLVLDVDETLVAALAARPEVARIDSNRAVRGIEDPDLAAVALAPLALAAVEPGVSNVRAPEAWQLGHTGAGIVIGDADTGVRWTHAAIKNKYRGWNGSSVDHNYNWHDAVHSGGGVCGANTTAPCDDNGHGTHTVGTLVGDDGSANKTGVAPGARWIGCRNMNQGAGTPASYSECFQFFLAPTNLAGQNANPDLRPDIVTNSWTCPPSEGCTAGAELETIVNNMGAAGIFVVAAAGNYGPSCSTVDFPVGWYSGAFAVGATDAGNNTLGTFSARGPSSYYSPALMKPNLVAPGVNVRSATRTGDTAYVLMTGTSMATPHVAGVVALLWSARPELVGDINATRQVLEASANPQVIVDPPERCGERNSWDVPNNSFGWGRVDALAAIGESVPPPSPAPTATPTAGPTATAGPTVPSAPRNVHATAGNASAQVSWSAPTTNGGSAITGYTATSNPGSRTCSTSGALGCTVTSLVNGTSYTFTVRATNNVGTGPASAPSNSVTPSAPDNTAPSAAVPVARLIAPSSAGGSIIVRVSWAAASDPSGIARYDLLRSINGGAWVTINLPTPTSRSVDLALTPGNTYQFALRATDGAGNSGGYTTSPSARLARSQETSASIAYSGAWRRVALSGASGGYVRKATSSAARATYSFSSTGAGFVSTVGPGRGKADIWLDGVKVATVDLYASTQQAARLVWASNVLSAGNHTLQVRVTGTKNAAASNVRVDVDAFVRWS